VSAYSGPTRRRTSDATTSVARRLRQKATVRQPPSTKAAARRATSTLVEARAPVSASSSGGFHSANRRSPRGEASATTGCTGRPHSSDAKRAGSPMVADENTKVGSDP
jgi:hypothetical protein